MAGAISYVPSCECQRLSEGLPYVPDNNINRELQTRVEGLASKRNKNKGADTKEILATNKKNAELFQQRNQQLAPLLQAMTDRRWEEALALLRELPELLLREETLGHPELSNASAPLLELVFASAPSTFYHLAASQAATVTHTLAQAGSGLATVNFRQPLSEEDVQSLARFASEKELRVRAACR